MSDVKGRAREALTSLGDDWQSTDGVVWTARIIAVPDPSDETGQTPMPDWIQEKVCDTSKEFAPIIASLPALVADLLSLVEEQEAKIARAKNLAGEAACGLHWYLNCPQDGPPPRERVTRLIAELEAL